MTIDLSNSVVYFYLLGEKPSGSLYVSLKSKYNNKYLTDGSSTQLEVTPVEWYTNWWKGSFEFQSSSYENIDIAGYYDFELYTSNSLSSTKLVKVVNNWDNIKDTFYTGSNENNEQIIYYNE
jgi:hypothetical protein